MSSAIRFIGNYDVNAEGKFLWEILCQLRKVSTILCCLLFVMASHRFSLWSWSLFYCIVFFISNVETTPHSFSSY
ncbi:hypothetical protein Y032_0041g444 [Ancylostoma ceylanicum]|uniref:Uncharacterized protein n=1 Tax=Ancylostoma ceylanicum TaxID=53326 RepID=A0A016UI24_9BILA|nr:hypothetical protein Y032_0041g444 [Ancylostoma ceylanicum]